MAQRSSRQLFLFIFILYTIHLCHSTPWGYPTKTRIIISNGPPITQFKGTTFKLVPASSSRGSGRRHVHSPGRRQNGFKPSLADCKNQGDWKPIIGPSKSNFDADIKTFQNGHHEENHESPQHSIEHHEQAPPNFDSFESTQHHQPSNPGREVKPASWAISTSNIDFSGGNSDFSGNNNNDYGSNNNNNDYGNNNNNNDYGNNNNDYGSVSNPGLNSVSFGTDPWWKSNEDGFKSSGPSGENQSNQGEVDISDDNSFISHTSKDYAVHEKVEGDIPPPKMRPNGGRQLLPSIVPSSTPKPFRPPPPPPPPPSPPTSHSHFRPNFFRKRRQKPSSTFQLPTSTFQQIIKH